MSVSFSIKGWSGWLPTTTSLTIKSSEITVSETPDVSQIPAMLRRRLNLLGRACASQIMQFPEAARSAPLVYCSQHGDIERTVGVLHELVDNEPVSPMHFSLAVHNAVAGVMSIQNKNTANISAIAANQEGLLPTIWEAVGLLSAEQPEILCVICDVPLPKIYQEHNKHPETAYAVSFLVTANQGVPLSLSRTSDKQEYCENRLQPIEFIEFLSSNQKTFSVMHNNNHWSITK